MKLPGRTQGPFDEPVLVRAPDGLFNLAVIDVESEGSYAPDLPFPDVIIAVVLALGALWRLGNRRRSAGSEKLRYEARVTSLAFPAERCVAKASFVLKRDAESKCEDYAELLRNGWNPTAEPKILPGS